MQNCSMRLPQGDRFISQRSHGEDVASKFGTKVEIFSLDKEEADAEERKNNQLVNQSQKQETNLIEEENKKMYTALLQNQVLGIDNPLLLHEIHNSDENYMKPDLYTQMQRQTHMEQGYQDTSMMKKYSFFTANSNESDASPFNTKYTVLKFNSNNTKTGQQSLANDSIFGRTVFSNTQNYYSQCSDSFSQMHQSMSMNNPGCLIENQQPYGNTSAFSNNPLCGFDEEQVIVPKKKQRKIAKIPFKVLDAPALQDDFYLNLVDWSSYNNLAVGLSSCIYIWSASSSKVTKLYDLGPRDCVTSVCWSKRGQHLSVGTNSGVVQIWDVNKCKLLRVMKGHEGRVGALAWSSNILSSGSKDKNILQRDLRAKDDFFGVLSYHKQEVCGLKWSFDEQQLASGGNDNKLLVWSVHNNAEPQGKFVSHLAAVKAITWSPHQHGLLVSGGGTADRCIRFWNTLQMQELNSIETGSQVCNLLFSKNVNEIVSTHGYSDNAIVVWKYPSMKKVATLTGHSLRVLYLAMSPDGETIVTGAGDETLRFWKVFPQLAGHKDREVSMIDPSSFNIR